MRAYDPTTGALNWSSAETPLNSIVSPIALRTSDAELAWSRSISTPYVSTPLSMDGMLYVVKDDQGVVYGIDATPGELHDDGFTALVIPALLRKGNPDSPSKK